MKKFDGILICTDLDGTLLTADKRVSEENLEAIEYFKSEGGIFTFITGRVPYTSLGICDIIHPNAPFGCVNGGALYDHIEKKYIWTEELDRSALELVEYIDKQVDGIGIQINTYDRIYFSRENSAMALFRAATGSPNIVRDYHEVFEPIAKVIFGDVREDVLLRVADLLQNHPRANEFGFIRSERKLYEILPKGISKGSVLPRLADHLSIDMRKTIAVGDYNNDIAMLRAAGIGIAVDNARPEVKAVADYVTVDNEHSAIAKIISDIEAGVFDAHFGK